MTRIVQAFGLTGLGFVLYPFIRAFLPAFEEDLGLDVRVGGLVPGESMIVDWLGRRVYILRRTRAMIDWFAARDHELALKDPASADSRQPAFALNPYRSLRPEYFVAFNNCTHLGCEVAKAKGRTEGIGFECPCHQSRFDYAGRVVEGAAAPLNLEVPVYRFVSGNVLRLESERA